MFANKYNIIIKIIVIIVFIGFLSLPLYFSYLSKQSQLKKKAIASAFSQKQFGFFLEEVSEKSGINFIHQSPKLDPKFDPILPQIASMGASVSICDFDNDGWNDIYVTNSLYGTKNALFHNQKNGTFIDVAEKYGIADINKKGTGVSMGSVWADYDNDGYEDLFIYKWGRCELFKNNKGLEFINVTENSRLPKWINSNSAIWFDYNLDGNIDLFIGGYFPENIDLWNLTSTKVLTESFEYAKNGGRNYLFKNNGDGTFVDVTDNLGLTSTRWTLAAGAIDINNDYYPELIIANDYGIDEFYINEKGKKFVESSNNTMIGFSPKSGMNVSFGDVNNNGKPGIYISNITEDGVLLQGNNFWLPVIENQKILFVNTAKQKGIESGGWCYAAQFGDLNNDGSIDLYVANGFISGKKGTNYWYDYSKVTSGNSAIISDIKNWPAMRGRSQSGYQQNRIWMNEGSGHFYDVSKYVIDDEEYDSRAVALVDLWNRGVLDIVIANQNNKLLVYKNNVDPKNQWIDFKLEGVESNKSAIGAMVKLYWNDKIQTQLITGGMGFSSQNQRRLHFGLGQISKIDSAVILWPFGREKTIISPEIRKIHRIKENSNK